MALTTSDILFTMQHHEADRAGPHNDIRLVIGEVAHSWATRKDIPEPGKSIMLYETSLHTKDYALRKRIVIPKGNYGSGVTNLIFARKAKLIENKDKGHFVLETTQGERYLLKPIPTPKGKTWLFKNLGESKEAGEPKKDNKYLQKASSLLIGTGLGHLAQNTATNVGLRLKSVSHHLANQFAMGYNGKVPSGLKSKVIGSIGSVLTPDLHLMGKTLNDMGRGLRDTAPNMTKRDHVGLRMLSEGRFSDLHKYGLHDRPAIKHVMHTAAEKHGIKLEGGVMLPEKAKALEKLWHDPKYPLLSNIASGMSHGKVPATATTGRYKSTTGIASSAAAMAVEPGMGALSAVKHISTSEVVKKTKIGKKISDISERVFLKNPIKKGWGQGADYREGLKTRAMETLVNPTSAHLQRTSAAISAIAKKK